MCERVSVCVRVRGKRQQAHNGFLILGNQKQIIGKKTDPALGKLGTDGQREAGNQEREREHETEGEKEKDVYERRTVEYPQSRDVMERIKRRWERIRRR